MSGLSVSHGLAALLPQIPDVQLPPDHNRQMWVAVLFATGILIGVIELVRRRKLREEYSLLWLVSAAALLVMAIVPSTIVTLASWIGAGYTTSALFFFALVFLLLLCLQFSVRLSKLTNRSKLLVQRMALMEQELDQLRGERHSVPPGSEAPARASGDSTSPAGQRPSRISDR